MNVIGIDLGTTALCGLRVNLETGRVEAAEHRTGGGFLPTPHPWERIQDGEGAVSIAREILDLLIDRETVAIGVTGQMHGILYFDRAGKAVSPLYTWQDGRGDLLRPGGESYSEYLHTPTGYGTVTDLYNRENGLVPPGACGFTTLQDYFVMSISGRKTPFMHTTNGASLGRFDLKGDRAEYDFLGEMTGDFALAGAYRGISVSVAIGDNQASVFGALSGKEEILINVGTGSQVSFVSDEIRQGENLETRPYFGGKKLLVGAALCGGSAYALLERFCAQVVYAATGKEESMYEMLDKLPLPEGELPRVDTRFAGTRRDPTLRGGIWGISRENFTPAALKVAFLEGIVSELYTMFREMGAVGSALVGAGNGLRKNPALFRAAEDIFGLPMRLPLHREEAAFGAALFGAVSSGRCGSAETVQGIIRYEERSI